MSFPLSILAYASVSQITLPLFVHIVRSGSLQQLSQFWYDEATCRVLASEALRLAGPCGRVACLSSPTLYRHLRKIRPPELKRE